MAADIFLPRFLSMKAVYWAFKGTDDFGKPTYDTAIEIKCRWEENNEQFIDSKGSTATSRAIVLVDRDLVLQGVLKQGKLSSVTNLSSPFKNKGAWEIRGWVKVPDANGKKFVRKALL
jgi:hypothetical protein